MGTAAKRTRENRTIPVEFRDAATYVCLIAAGKAFLEGVIACLLSLGCQRQHKATGHGGGGRTRHAHDARIRLGGVTSWRLQGTTCQAVFTGLPHGVWR
jgi:hypothetical protein